MVVGVQLKFLVSSMWSRILLSVREEGEREREMLFLSVTEEGKRVRLLFLRFLSSKTSI
jgi:hypothetical protein